MSNTEYIKRVLNRIAITNTYILRLLCKNNKEFEETMDKINNTIDEIDKITKESSVDSNDRT